MQRPQTGPEYYATFANVFAILLALPAGISGFRRCRRGRPMARFGAGWSTGWGAYAAAVVFLVVGSVVAGVFAAKELSTSAAGGGYDFVPDASVAIATEDFAFSPTTLTVRADVLTEIAVDNRDSAFHTFTYEKDGVEYSHDLLAGGTTRFLVRFDAPGEVRFWCEPHSAGAEDDGEGMIGTITVEA